MLKTVALLLALSAIAVFGQSGDEAAAGPSGVPADNPAEDLPHAPAKVVLDYDECVAHLAAQIEKVAILKDVMAVVEQSRAMYGKSFEDVVRGKTTEEYEDAMEKLPYIKQCQSFLHEFWGAYNDRLCTNYINAKKEEDQDTFMLNVAHTNRAARDRIDAFIACLYIEYESPDTEKDAGGRADGSPGESVAESLVESVGENAVEDQ